MKKQKTMDPIVQTALMLVARWKQSPPEMVVAPPMKVMARAQRRNRQEAKAAKAAKSS